MIEEIWKDIEGYEGIYMISNYGRVKTYERVLCDGKKSKVIFKSMHYRGIRKNTEKGYLSVRLFKNGIGKHFSVHRLVATAFVSNESNKTQVNHIDCNKNNNHFSNLEWCSRKENSEHASKNKLFKPRYGDLHHNRKLSVKDVIHIRKEYNCSQYATQKNLAKGYGVDSATICDIVNNKRWTHIK